MPSHHHHHHKRASDPPAPTPTRSNLGPLTTPFAPPSHCTRAIFGCETCSTAWHALTCNKSRVGPRDDSSCWPPATAYPSHSEPYLSGLGFYSPGLFCPTSYYNACTAISTFPSQKDVQEIMTKGPMKDGSFQFPLIEGETAVGCCPIGYTCATYPGLGWQTCHRAVTSTHLSRDQAGTCGEKGEVKELELNIKGKLEFWAPLVQINWQASDRETVTADVAAGKPTRATARMSHSMDVPLASVVSGATSTAVTATPTAEPPPPPPPSKGLSKQTITGITISMALVSLSVTAFILYLWFRRRDPNANRRSSVAHIAGKPSTPDSSVASITSLNSSPLSAKKTPTLAPGTAKVLNFAAFTAPASKPKARPSPPIGTRAMSPFSVRSEMSAINDRDLDFPLPPSNTAMARLDQSHNAAGPPSPLFGRGLGVEDRDTLESPIDGTSPFKLKRGLSQKKKGQRTSWRDSWRDSWRMSTASEDG